MKQTVAPTASSISLPKATPGMIKKATGCSSSVHLEGHRWHQRLGSRASLCYAGIGERGFFKGLLAPAVGCTRVDALLLLNSGRKLGAPSPGGRLAISTCHHASPAAFLRATRCVNLLHSLVFRSTSGCQYSTRFFTCHFYVYKGCSFFSILNLLFPPLQPVQWTVLVHCMAPQKRNRLF